MKVYLDGDQQLPTLNGTGTEDYIGTGWGQGSYAQRYQGCLVADQEHMQYCFYRYHVPDPIYFRKEARVTIQQIGYLGPEEMGSIYLLEAAALQGWSGPRQDERFDRRAVRAGRRLVEHRVLLSRPRRRWSCRRWRRSRSGSPGYSRA